MRYLLLLAGVLLLAACAASPYVDTPAERSIGRWVGKPVDAVIASWGEPTVKLIEGDRRLFIWEASHYDSRYYPSNLNNPPRYPFLGGRDEIACKGVLEVDEQGIVQDAGWQGYECHFMP